MGNDVLLQAPRLNVAHMLYTDLQKCKMVCAKQISLLCSWSSRPIGVFCPNRVARQEQSLLEPGSLGDKWQVTRVRCVAYHPCLRGFKNRSSHNLATMSMGISIASNWLADPTASRTPRSAGRWPVPGTRFHALPSNLRRHATSPSHPGQVSAFVSPLDARASYVLTGMLGG